MAQPKIVSISCAVVRGDRREFVNVYGLDEQSLVWQWNAKSGAWEPNKVRQRSAPASRAAEGW